MKATSIIKAFLLWCIGKVKTSKATNSEPSTEELHAVVSDILKEVDFNTVRSFRLDALHLLSLSLDITKFCSWQATLADILRQLGMIKSTHEHV